MTVTLGKVSMLAALLLSACNHVYVHKVPHRGDYTTWDDAKQQAVDSMEGVRFYMARPYLVVHRPFPADATAFLVDGVVSPDGRSIRLTGDVPDALKGNLRAARADEPIEFPTALVFAAGARPGTPDAHGGVKTDAPPASGGDAGDEKETEPAPAPTGVAHFDMKRDLNAVGHFPLRGAFDLVYLQDFAEQYVLQVEDGFGSADVKLETDPGHVPTAVGFSTDNSAITAPLIAVYGDLLKAGSVAAQTALGVPPVPGVTIPAAQGSADMTAKAGAPVTLRATLVRYAVLGVYPLLKPLEVQPWREKNTTADGYFLIGGFGLKTFETLIVEELVGGAMSGGGASEGPSDRGQQKVLSAGTPADLTRLLDGVLSSWGFHVKQIVDLGERDQSGALKAPKLEIARNDGAPVTDEDKAKAKAAIDAAYAVDCGIEG